MNSFPMVLKKNTSCCFFMTLEQEAVSAFRTNFERSQKHLMIRFPIPLGAIMERSQENPLSTQRAWFHPQEPAAQIVAQVAQPSQGCQKVLDLEAAAPGGKTTRQSCLIWTHQSGPPGL